jgi:hypothetical protein
MCNCARETQSVSVERENLGGEKGRGFDLVCLLLLLLAVLDLQSLTYSYILPIWFGIWPARGREWGPDGWYAAMAVGEMMDWL